MKAAYRFLFWFARVLFFFAHPVFRVHGKENIPAGPAVVCCNHSNMSDPVWLCFGLNEKKMPRIMAKKQLESTAVLGPFIRSLGVIFVDREGTDVNAIKASLRALRDGEKLLIFPEGTRIRAGKVSEPKQGAALLASRTDLPLVPVFLTRNKRLFCPLKLCIGTPFYVDRAGAKATPEELQSATDRLMRDIYAMESDQ